MVVDTAPVLSALVDVGLAVGSVAAGALVVVVTVAIYKWLEWPLYVRERRREEADYQRTGKLWP